MIAVLQRRGRMPGECLPTGPGRELIFRHPGLGAALHAWAVVQPGPGEESVKNTALIATAAAAAASLLIAACGRSSSGPPTSTTTASSASAATSSTAAGAGSTGTAAASGSVA